MKRVLIRKILYCLFIAPSILLILLFSSCSADLGVFDKEDGDGYEDFYNSLDDVKFMFEKDNKMENKKYDIEKSLTNEYIIENLKWKDGAEEVELKQYVYIVIPFKRDLKVESLALYVKRDPNEVGNTGIELEFSAFYFPDSSSCPKDDKLKKFSDPDTHTITVQEETDSGTIEYTVEEEIEYPDPKKEIRISSAKYYVTRNFDDGFVLENFRQVDNSVESYVNDRCLMAKKDSYLYIRIENNSALNRNKMQPCNLSFINLLVRAI